MENKDLEFTPECDKEMELYFPKNDIYEPSIITIEEGISAHIDHDRESAWRCFNYHADLGNMLAKYWKGYYLWEGYGCGKDKFKAAKLFKEAADYGIPEAQLRYAFTHIAEDSINKENNQLFLRYITLAADNNNTTAQYNLGDMYYNGKLGVEKDQELGLKLIQIAAQNEQPKAMDFLNNLAVKDQHN